MFLYVAKELKLLASKKTSDVAVKSASDSSSDSDAEVRWLHCTVCLVWFFDI